MKTRRRRDKATSSNIMKMPGFNYCRLRAAAAATAAAKTANNSNSSRRDSASISSSSTTTSGGNSITGMTSLEQESTGGEGSNSSCDVRVLPVPNSECDLTRQLEKLYYFNY